MATLDRWLGENVETDENRDRVRSAASGLGDLRACELEDLQEALDLASWPVLAKLRFLKAWRELKGEGAPAPSEEAPRPASPPSPGPRPAREAAPGAAPTPAAVPVEDEEVEAEPAPAPAEEEAEAPPPPAPASAKYQVGDQVMARWLGKQGGWYEGTVVGVRANDDGKPVYSVAFDDDDQDDNVIERHIKALPAPATEEEVDDNATAPYENPEEKEEPPPRRRPRGAAATPAPKPKAEARGTAAKHPKPHRKIKRNSAGDAAEWDETTGEWFFRKPPGGPGAGRKGAKWDTKTGEWVGGSKPTKRAAPAAAAPAPKKRKESQARHAFAVGERVEAHWQKKWWPAAVHTLVGDGSYEVHWDDGRYDYVAANAVRSAPSGALARLGRIFGK